MRFTEADVVRHPLVQQIIRAYDRNEREDPEAAATAEVPSGSGAPRE